MSEVKKKAKNVSAKTEKNVSAKKANKPSAATPGMKYTVAKYVTAVLIGVFVVVMILAQRQPKVPFDQVRQAVEQAIDHETMTDAGIKGFRRHYKLRENDYDGIMVYQSLSGMSAEEVLLVKVRDRSQIEGLTDAIEARRESRMNDFAGYAPEEEALMQQGELLVKGNYVLFLPYRKAAEVKQAFLQALGD